MSAGNLTIDPATSVATLAAAAVTSPHALVRSPAPLAAPARSATPVAATVTGRDNSDDNNVAEPTAIEEDKLMPNVVDDACTATVALTLASRITTLTARKPAKKDYTRACADVLANLANWGHAQPRRVQRVAPPAGLAVLRAPSRGARRQNLGRARHRLGTCSRPRCARRRPCLSGAWRSCSWWHV
jgi:hypothetical protein